MLRLFQAHSFVPAAVQACNSLHLGAALFGTLSPSAAPLRFRRMRQAGKQAGVSGACCSGCNFVLRDSLTLNSRRSVAKFAVKHFVKSGDVVGIGFGTAATQHVVHALSQLLASGSLQVRYYQELVHVHAPLRSLAADAPWTVQECVFTCKSYNHMEAFLASIALHIRI